MYSALEKYDETLNIYRQVFEIRKNHFGLYHEKTTNPLEDSAWILSHVHEKYEEAEKMYRQVLEIYQKIYPPENEFIALAHFNIGACYEEQEMVTCHDFYAE